MSLQSVTSQIHDALWFSNEENEEFMSSSNAQEDQGRIEVEVDGKFYVVTVTERE